MRALILLTVAAITLALAAPARAAPTWLPASNLTGESADQSRSAIAVAPDGTTVVVWDRTAPGGSVVEAARRLPGEAFGAPIALTTAAEQGATPAVAMDGQGNATVAWAQAGGVVRASRLPVGAAAFEPTQTLSGASTQANQPALDVGSGGTAVVVFADGATPNRFLRAAVRDGAGGAFAAPTTISGMFAGFQTTGAGEPATEVAVSSAGDAAVAWAGEVAPIPSQRFQVEASFRPAGGGFPAVGDQPDTATAPASQTDPSVAIAAGGRVTLAWSLDPNIGSIADTPVVRYADRPVGGSYSPGVPASLIGERAAGPDLAATGDGTVIGVWSAGIGNDLKVQAATRPPGGAFGGHTNLSAPGMNFTLPTIAVNGAGEAMIIWGGFSAEGIFSVRRSANGSYGGVQEAANRAAEPPGDIFNFFNPRVALDEQGNASATWLFDHFRSVTSHYRIQTAAFDAAPPTLTASVPPGGTAGEAIGMAAAATDRLTPVSIHWAFGDGATADGGAVTHAFGAPGAFSVTVTATDGVGNAASATRPILVSAGAPPPGPPVITSPVRVLWGVNKKRIFLLRMKVLKVPKGGKAELRCKGKKCPFKRKSSKKRRKGAITLFKEIKPRKVVGKKQRSFRAGQRLQLRITAPGHIGKVVKYRLRKGRIPSGRTLCLPPGAAKPRKTC